MIGPTGRVRVFAYRAPCDMRKGPNTLSGLVHEMGHEVVSGDVYLFAAKNKKRAKVLWHDGTGLCLLVKRLDAGTFAALWEAEQPELTAGELRLFLDGCKQVGRVPLGRPRTDLVAVSRLTNAAFR